MSGPSSTTRLWAWRGGCVALLCVLALALGFPHLWRPTAAAPVARSTHLALVIPDELSQDDVHVKVWLDAANEAGFAMSLVRASTLLRPGGYPMDAALILPDTVHRRMNDALVLHLQQRVSAGAQLMLVNDAGVTDLDGNYHPEQSRLSSLAGVRYALYGQFGPRMMDEQVAWVDGAAVPDLRLPPGKLMRENSDNPLTSNQPVPLPNEELAVASYNYGRLRYPVFKTQGAFQGQRLMHSDGDGVLAGLHSFGQGKVLFVNLPLGYLKLRTDGFFLQSFLRYFAQDVAGLPQLSPLPDARGALIMNWHVDSAAAVPAMEALTALGAFTQGPYSIHLTAGPDVDRPGDGMGMDLPHNAQIRDWVRRFVERGDEVGTHGGWIHNEFGRMVDKQDPLLSQSLMEKNLAAVASASARPVREYSAPLGNHPAWVTPWLREHGIRAYYFTGDIGMAPTRSYQDGRRGPSDVWAFPVLSYGTYASFEEAHNAKVPEREIAAWLKDVADFCAQYRTVRLVYFHPPGIAMFPVAFKAWMKHTGALVNQHTLRWMTMAQYADFATERMAVNWQLGPDGDAAGSELLQASHSHSLAHFSWLLPVQRYEQPQLLAGAAQIERDGAYWCVVAGDAASLRLRLPLRAASSGSPSVITTPSP